MLMRSLTRPDFGAAAAHRQLDGLAAAGLAGIGAAQGGEDERGVVGSGHGHRTAGVNLRVVALLPSWLCKAVSAVISLASIRFSCLVGARLVLGSL